MERRPPRVRFFFYPGKSSIFPPTRDLFHSKDTVTLCLADIIFVTSVRIVFVVRVFRMLFAPVTVFGKRYLLLPTTVDLKYSKGENETPIGVFFILFFLNSLR